MFVRLALLLIGSISVTVICWRVYLRAVVPALRHRRIERLERENDDLNKIIQPDHAMSRREK